MGISYSEGGVEARGLQKVMRIKKTVSWKEIPPRRGIFKYIGGPPQVQGFLVSGSSTAFALSFGYFDVLLVGRLASLTDLP